MCPATRDTEKLPESMGVLLRLVKSELMCAMEEELTAQGVDLRHSQVHALRCLYLSGPMSAGELARALAYDAGAMTRLLDQLEERGYLHRRPDPDDRRALRIELSTSGTALVRKLADYKERVLDRALGALDDEERRRLTDYLQRVLITLRQSH
ncbi:MAG TPA: MarR family transcriptional regulator [Gammaproteobacteria bacterium]|nr:MarR family transcriptional regulator [Gammaproteobacteria bacterium]